jgi:ParB-like chromosome segregation protein Spo0J
MAKRIELWPVERLVPYERNARTHSPQQVAQIAASISEFGFLNPILVDSKDGIIAGHGRLAAAKDMGLVEVPVVVLDHLTPAQRKAYVLADNRIALNAGWDVSLLAEELAGLQLQEFDLDLLGFDEKELQGLLDPEQIDSEGPPDEFKEVDDDIETEHRCPSCGYEWSGKTK